MSEQETQETLKVEEIINVLRNMKEAFRKERIEELRDLASRITNLLACLGNYPSICVIELSFATFPNVVIDGIGEIINGNTTVNELRDIIIKNIIVKNADKIIYNILTELRNVIDNIIYNIEKEEEDP